MISLRAKTSLEHIRNFSMWMEVYLLNNTISLETGIFCCHVITRYTGQSVEKLVTKSLQCDDNFFEAVTKVLNDRLKVEATKVKKSNSNYTVPLLINIFVNTVKIPNVPGNRSLIECEELELAGMLLEFISYNSKKISLELKEHLEDYIMHVLDEYNKDDDYCKNISLRSMQIFWMGFGLGINSRMIRIDKASRIEEMLYKKVSKSLENPLQPLGDYYMLLSLLESLSRSTHKNKSLNHELTAKVI